MRFSLVLPRYRAPGWKCDSNSGEEDDGEGEVDDGESIRSSRVFYFGFIGLYVSSQPAETYINIHSFIYFVLLIYSAQPNILEFPLGIRVV